VQRDIRALLAVALAGVAVSSMAADDRTVSVFAAGSLRPALVEIGRAFEGRERGVQVRFTFGASGLLKDRLLQSERADVFASATGRHVASKWLNSTRCALS